MRPRMSDDVVSTIKSARRFGCKYEVAASYYVVNQGRGAGVMKGRITPSIQPAKQLVPDFPTLT
jgi:hypothetical protein